MQTKSPSSEKSPAGCGPEARPSFVPTTDFKKEDTRGNKEGTTTGRAVSVHEPGPRVFELSVPGIPETLLICPDELAEQTKAREKNQGRVWSFSEIRAARGLSVEEARKAAEAKIVLHATKMWATGPKSITQKAITF